MVLMQREFNYANCNTCRILGSPLWDRSYVNLGEDSKKILLKNIGENAENILLENGTL